MTQVYNFTEQLKLGRLGEELFYKYFYNGVIWLNNLKIVGEVISNTKLLAIN